ncbi:uncharacterized protein LOC143188192 [Calliopsis andreniformis]|uniref:uncharacterized protein LOC143188192 n=1 Tax=Calliopsis andreniformis TaxID=337506 RepID=UPI003FCCC423
MIRTFIFFDLETTGFITKTMPKIIELSLVAVSSTAICDIEQNLPRVLHKLVLPIFPCKQIPPKVQEITGLSLTNLENVQCFDSVTCSLITNFLKSLVPPVCFVAYNGNAFDYPIFLWELQDILKTQKVLSEEVLSIDMLYLVKDYFANKYNPIENETDNILLNDGHDETVAKALDNVNFEDSDNTDDSEMIMKEEVTEYFNLDTPKTSYYEKMQKINEKTPESQKFVAAHCSSKTRFNSLEQEELQHSPGNLQDKKRNIKRRLNFTNDPPSNFKLTTVCKHIVGAIPENAHNAEGDCLLMIRCAIRLGNYFVQWANKKAVPLITHSRNQ